MKALYVFAVVFSYVVVGLCVSLGVQYELIGQGTKALVFGSMGVFALALGIFLTVRNTQWDALTSAS